MRNRASDGAEVRGAEPASRCRCSPLGIAVGEKISLGYFLTCPIITKNKKTKSVRICDND